MPRRMLRTVLTLSTLQILSILPVVGQYSPTKIMNALQNKTSNLVLLTSHRGEINGAYETNAPENSEGAAINAIHAGIEMVEIDIRVTQDHVAYLMHDTNLQRMLQINLPADYRVPQGNRPVAPNASTFMGSGLCGGRGVVKVAGAGISPGQCLSPYLTSSGYAQSEPVVSLSQFVNDIAPYSKSSIPWGGVIQLDIRDQEGLIQSWNALVNSAYTNNQVIFKFNPARLKIENLTQLKNVLCRAAKYNPVNSLTCSNGGAQSAGTDILAHMNFMPVYQVEGEETAAAIHADQNWAINDWEDWVAVKDSFHRLLSPMVGAKSGGGRFVLGNDALYHTVADSSSLNVVGIYSTYLECTNTDGAAITINWSSPYNGYFSTGGKCVALKAKIFESSDLIDHRYDPNFIYGVSGSTAAQKLSASGGPLNFRMVIADTATAMRDYLASIHQRDNLAAIKP